MHDFGYSLFLVQSKITVLLRLSVRFNTRVKNYMLIAHDYNRCFVALDGTRDDTLPVYNYSVWLLRSRRIIFILKRAEASETIKS